MKLLYRCVLVLFLVGCEKGAEFVSVQELGCDESEMSVTYQSGSCEFHILANGNYTATILGEVPWAELVGSEDGRSVMRRGDGLLTVRYETNRSQTRTMRICVVSGDRELTLQLTQQGLLTQSLELEDRKILVGNEGGKQYAKILTPFVATEYRFTVTYETEGVSGWISGVALENNYLVFEAQPNYAAAENRDASITVLAVDKDGNDYAGTLHVMQTFAGNTFREIDFDELCALLPTWQTEMTLEGDMKLSGIVSNDNADGNGAENHNFSASLQDLEVAARTLYVEDPESGSRGLRVEMADGEVHFTKRYDRITLRLDGLILTREGSGVPSENDPVRYVLSGVTNGHLLQVEAGSVSNLPVKRKRIAELTDEDVYTFVTLTDCEIPIRKGPFMPIDLRHRHVLNKYPMVVRDMEGSTTHLMINTTCTFARDGHPMPQGSGDISGVVVHETCDQFEWNTALAAQKEAGGIASEYITHIGSIGRYQIRPVSREDIDLAEDFRDGFSEMICEFRYYNRIYDALVKNVGDDYVIHSTYPAVADPLTDPDLNGILYCETTSGSVGNILPKRDWTHLGPVVDNVITDPTNGNGVVDYYSVSAHWSVYSSVSTTGLMLEANGSSWFSSSGLGTSKYWCVEFSTLDIDASHGPMSVQAGVVNGYGANVGAPRYWAVEYSTDDKVSWTRVATYTVPDFPIVVNKRSWQCPAHKYVSFTFPEDADVWGKERVCIRLIPTQNTAGSVDAYDGAAIVSGQDTSMNYLAVRYNK